MSPEPWPPAAGDRPAGGCGCAAPSGGAADGEVIDPAVVRLPEDALRTPTGAPAAVVVRTGRGWTVLAGDAAAERAEDLVPALSLADLIAAEHGATPEPGREARRAARTGGTTDADGAPADPRDEELATLRRTVGQLEHALAARVSIERAIGVLAERHGTSPREAFDELRQRARSQGRPALELAAEVLDGLPARAAGHGPHLVPGAADRHAPGGQAARRVQRHGRRPGGDAVPGARS